MYRRAAVDAHQGVELRVVLGLGRGHVKLSEARLVAVRAERHVRRVRGPNREGHSITPRFVGVGCRELPILVDPNERVRDGGATLVCDHPRQRDREGHEPREPERRARRPLDGLEGRGEHQQDARHRREGEPSSPAGSRWRLLRVDDRRQDPHRESSR